MTTEQNKATVRRYYDQIWTQGKLALIDELFTEDYVNEDPASPGRCMKGREGLKQLIGGYREAFHEMKMTITDQWADGDTVISKWTANAVHKGPMMGFAPTGRKASPEGITISTFRAGKISHDYAVWDALGLYQTLAAKS